MEDRDMKCYRKTVRDLVCPRQLGSSMEQDFVFDDANQGEKKNGMRNSRAS